MPASPARCLPATACLLLSVDVGEGDVLLVDGGLISFCVKKKWNNTEVEVGGGRRGGQDAHAHRPCVGAAGGGGEGMRGYWGPIPPTLGSHLLDPGPNLSLESWIPNHLFALSFRGLWPSAVLHACLTVDPGSCLTMDPGSCLTMDPGSCLVPYLMPH